MYMHVHYMHIYKYKSERKSKLLINELLKRFSKKITILTVYAFDILKAH